MKVPGRLQSRRASAALIYTAIAVALGVIATGCNAGFSGVLTFHNDNARDGLNSQETTLTPANVNTGSFGKRTSCPVDGAIYGQPLWVGNLTVGGTGKTPVVFIHGLWLLPSSWDRWRTVFEAAGYATLSPGWPDDPDTVEEAKEHPEVFAHKTVGRVADHYGDVIGKLTKKPAVIGHSFGGLLTQIVAGRGLSAASVAMRASTGGRAKGWPSKIVVTLGLDSHHSALQRSVGKPPCSGLLVVPY